MQCCRARCLFSVVRMCCSQPGSSMLGDSEGPSVLLPDSLVPFTAVYARDKLLDWQETLTATGGESPLEPERFPVPLAAAMRTGTLRAPYHRTPAPSGLLPSILGAAAAEGGPGLSTPTLFPFPLCRARGAMPSRRPDALAVSAVGRNADRAGVVRTPNPASSLREASSVVLRSGQGRSTRVRGAARILCAGCQLAPWAAPHCLSGSCTNPHCTAFPTPPVPAPSIPWLS